MNNKYHPTAKVRKNTKHFTTSVPRSFLSSSFLPACPPLTEVPYSIVVLPKTAVRVEGGSAFAESGAVESEPVLPVSRGDVSSPGHEGDEQKKCKKGRPLSPPGAASERTQAGGGEEGEEAAGNVQSSLGDEEAVVEEDLRGREVKEHEERRAGDRHLAEKIPAGRRASSDESEKGAVHCRGLEIPSRASQKLGLRRRAVEAVVGAKNVEQQGKNVSVSVAHRSGPLRRQRLERNEGVELGVDLEGQT